MCGIVGELGAVDRDRLARMTAALRHRGPDAEAIWIGEGIGFGHRRLVVIDREGGAQPMSSPDGRYTVTYNGEIYGFAALRRELEAGGRRFHGRSDTEVLLAGFERWGEDVVHRIDGMFAFAIWDRLRRRLVLARDRVGIKPLYHARTAEGLAFASEPKALLLHPEVARALDPIALDAYLDLGYVPAPRSIFAGIAQLAPGHRLIHEDGHTRIERYWDAAPEPRDELLEEEWAETVAPVLEAAIVAHTVSDVPVGVFLSGGLDSSTIVAVLAERGVSPLRTFAVGYPGEGASWEERPMAARVARAFATEHHELELDAALLGGLDAAVVDHDEPFASPTALLSAALSRFVRERVTVALAGDGGDELFGGYPRYLGMRLAAGAERLPAAGWAWLERVAGRERVGARSMARHVRTFAAAATLPSPERYARFVGYLDESGRDRLLAPELRAEVHRGVRLRAVEEAFARPAHGDDVERATYADLHGFLPENVLRCSDRAGMRFGLEIRVPFCDHRLFELMARVPSRHRVGVLASKRILRRIMRGRLPAPILRRRKLGFNAPLPLWLARGRTDLLDRHLAPEIVARRGLLDPTEVARLRAEHDAGVRDHGVRLWSLVFLEAWARRYLD